eukprot:CAMPEP_0180639634 /NCGR_PEP_ID=MMETSP1037_2-20121125/45155_1 /TAXON_ID=632150 /ORGANISM="Azadinium spinosum, Strain 3D9" /LENGTH=44 /DNA_ID= /DNA_START= /DNA_END= /DNA_ORIENTATION=
MTLVDGLTTPDSRPTQSHYPTRPCACTDRLHGLHVEESRLTESL